MAALICYRDQILVAQRKAQDSNGGAWEFPGGKVELGETLEQALRREIQEELALDIRIGKLIESREFVTPSGKKIQLSLFATEAQSQAFELHEHDQACWVHPQDLDSLGFLEGNRQFLPAVMKWWKENHV
ncbi:MAG: (deoxy)nucleoside triphosphate pyrophosphohydrolase [Bdellovibrionales bacterium]